MPPPGRFFDMYGSRFGSLRCPGNGDVPQSCKRAEKNTAFRLESDVFMANLPLVDTMHHVLKA